MFHSNNTSFKIKQLTVLLKKKTRRTIVFGLYIKVFLIDVKYSNSYERFKYFEQEMN